MKRNINHYISKHYKVIINVCMALAIGTVFFAANSGKANAVILSGPSGIPTDIQQNMANYDSSSGTPDNYNCVPPASGGVTQYQQTNMWLFLSGNSSVDGSASAPFQASPGQTLTLNVATLLFLCHEAIAETAPSAPGQQFNFSDINSNPVDGFPYTTNGQSNSPLVNNSSVYLSNQEKFEYGTPKLSGPGSLSTTITGAPTESINYQTGYPSNATRYWFPTTGFSQLTYTAPTTASTYSVSISLPVYPANWFDESSGNIFQCVESKNLISQTQYDGSFQSLCSAAPITFNIEIQVIQPVQVESNVFTVNNNGTGYTQVPGVQLETCGYDSTEYQGQYNYYYFTATDVGDGYCVRLSNTAYGEYIANYDGPFTRPWDNDGNSTDYYPSKVPADGITTSCGTAATGGPYNTFNQNHCPINLPSYECQTAGEYSSPDECGYNSLDRSSDWGFDFEYVGFVPNCTSQSACPGNPSCTIGITTATGYPPAFNTPYTITYMIHNGASVTPLVFNASTAPPSPYSTTFSNSPGLGVTVTDPYTASGGTVSIAPGASQTFNFNSSGSAIGKYQLSMNIVANNIYGSGNITDYTCTSTYYVTAEPYLRVFGGDVQAGLDSNYISSCYDTPAGIESYNNGQTGTGNGHPPTNTGAGTTNAALATNPISGFASGLYNSPLSMLDPLTYSNSTGPPGYGGSYGSSSTYGNCGGTDYYSAIAGTNECTSHATSLGIVSASPATITLTPGESPQIYCPPPGSSFTINDNVVYDPTMWKDGAKVNASSSNLPIFEVVTEGASSPSTGGSIYVNSNVTELAGTYISELYNGNGGTICDNYVSGAGCEVSEPATINSTNTAVNDRLVIDGAFVANNLNLYRSYGSWNDDTTQTLPGSEQYDAEEFDYSPLNWLIPSSTGPSPSLSAQSITSLPPVY